MPIDLKSLLNHVEVMTALRDAGVTFSQDDEELFALYGTELLRFEKLSSDFTANLDAGNYIRAGASAPALANQTEMIQQLHRRVVSKIQPIVDAITKKEN